IDIAGGTAPLIVRIDPVRQKAASVEEYSARIDRGQPVPGRKRDDEIAVKGCEGTRRDDHATVRATRESSDATLNFAGTPHADRGQFNPDQSCRALQDAQLASPGGETRVAQDRDPCRSRCNLLEQFQPFPAEAIFVKAKAGGVAARPRQALNESTADRISDVHEHTRYGPLH